MIAVLAGLIAFVPHPVLFAQSEQAAPGASEIISKMLKRYHEAASIRGTIELDQTAAGSQTNTRLIIATTVQAAKPNKFFIEQSRVPPSGDDSVPSHFMAVSDGKQMSYSLPKNTLPLTQTKVGRLYEAAPPGIDGGLNAFCTLLLDRSFPVAVALYNPYEIERFTKKLIGLAVEGEATVSDRPAWRLRANYVRFQARTEGGQAPVTVPLYIYVDKEFNLLGIVWEEGVVDGQQTLKVTSRWAVRLEVNAKLDEGLFRVR